MDLVAELEGSKVYTDASMAETNFRFVEIPTVTFSFGCQDHVQLCDSKHTTWSYQREQY